jgi:myo-inositol-1(or 4)-monophosphatase
MDTMYPDILRLINVLADASANVILQRFRHGYHVELKADLSPVTEADREAEDLMRDIIQQYYPEHGIVGEEFGAWQEHAEFVWYLDPIDGTKSFISGTPLFGTLIALCRNGRPVFGCINLPVLEQRLLGNGTETRLNGKRVHMRSANSLDQSVLLTTDHHDVFRYKNGKTFHELIRRVAMYRTWGDCYGYALLATGFADIMVDPVLKPWDMYAIIPVIEGAGGIITSYEGGDPLHANSLVAASPQLHEKVLQALHPAEETVLPNYSFKFC